MRRQSFSATNLNRLQGQLLAWRRNRSGRSRLPEALWRAATGLARTQGPSLVARTLRLDYYKLRRRLEEGASAPTVAPSFVELKREPICTVSPNEWSAELADGTGARMSLRVPNDLATVVALAQNFWRRGR